jgi:small subunit ribosomal protein S9
LNEQAYFYGTGKRKTSVARVRILTGDGTITINGKPFAEVCARPLYRTMVLQPFEITGTTGKFNVVATVQGGGVSSQIGAVRHGISRALVVMDEALRPTLRRSNLLTRDSRMKERKKYGLKRARKAPQYTKR